MEIVAYRTPEDNNVPTKQPDPVTGLVPCGCGGEAVRYGRDSYNGFFTTGCSKCGTLSWGKFFQDEADKSWNTAMGYTAPPRPGAIGPETGEMAPNGDEGAEL